MMYCPKICIFHLKLAGVLHVGSTAQVGINTRYCNKTHLGMMMMIFNYR